VLEEGRFGMFQCERDRFALYADLYKKYIVCSSLGGRRRDEYVLGGLLPEER